MHSSYVHSVFNCIQNLMLIIIVIYIRNWRFLFSRNMYRVNVNRKILHIPSKVTSPKSQLNIILIYLLTAIGLSPGGSSTVQYTFTHKQYTEQHNETEHTEQNVHNNNNT
jgi:hypothetical protein